MAGRLVRQRKAYATVLMLGVLLMLAIPTVQGHAKQVQQTGDYEITYFSDPQDPIADSPATLFLQVRNVTSGVQLRVFHFLLEMIPPSGPRQIQHPLSDRLEGFTFDQPGNWVLLFEIGLTNLLGFDTTATFVADVSQARAGGLLGAFANVLIVTIPRTYARWGHIFAVVMWLGMMLHVVQTYWFSSRTSTGLAGFARTFRRSDIVVAGAVVLLISTGIVRAFAHGLTTVPSLFESDFGLVLFVKISLAAGMIGIGLVNRIFLLRKLERTVDNTGATDPSQTELQLLQKNESRVLARRIYFLVIFEMGLGVIAILFGTIFTQIHTIT